MKAPNSQRRKKTVYRSRRLTRILKASVLASLLAASSSVAQAQKLGEPTDCWASCHAEATDFYNNDPRPHDEKIGDASDMFNSCLEESLCS